MTTTLYRSSVALGALAMTFMLMGAKKAEADLAPIKTVAVVSVTLEQAHSGDVAVYQGAVDAAAELLREKFEGAERWTVSWPDAEALGDVAPLSKSCASKRPKAGPLVHSGAFSISHGTVIGEKYTRNGQVDKKRSVSFGTKKQGASAADMMAAMQGSGNYNSAQMEMAQKMMGVVGGDSAGAPSESCDAALGKLAATLGVDAVLAAHVVTGSDVPVQGVKVVESGRAVGEFLAQGALALVTAEGKLAFMAGKSMLQQFSDRDVMPIHKGRKTGSKHLDLTHGRIPERVAEIAENSLLGPLGKLLKKLKKLDKDEAAE